MTMGAQVTIDGIPIDAIRFDHAVRLALEWAQDGSGGYVCTPNVDHFVLARRYPRFRQALLGARLRVPDGMGVVYGSWIAGGVPLRSSVTGRLIPAPVSARLGALGVGTALVGWRPEVLARAASRLTSMGANIVAAVAPSAGATTGSDDEQRMVEALLESQARAVFVALGSPEQELWMARNSSRLPQAVLVGVGAAVDVLGGRVREAPRWMTSVGLEWFFRLAQEPRRLAKRYLWDDPRFFAWMVQERLGEPGDP
jgi:N-acetylglucosaminyldiphosphoundecaprenol N-acetyl-beta-D-mannosaminyltransferase